MAKLNIRIIPNASKTEVVGKEGGAWKIRLAAPPVDGKANAALIGFLSGLLDLPKSLIEITKGQASRHKTVEMPGNIQDIEERLR